MMPKEAEPLIEKELKEDPEMGGFSRYNSLVAGQTRRGAGAGLEFSQYGAKIGVIIHYTYWIARVFAQGGKSEEALRWLRYTAENASPVTRSLSATRSRSDRRSPSFKQFMQR